MKKTKALILSLVLLTGIGAQAKDYNASLFLSLIHILGSPHT